LGLRRALNQLSNPQASYQAISGREPKDVRNRLVKLSAKLVMSRSRLCKIKE
jgi:hypothetical protein